MNGDPDLNPFPVDINSRIGTGQMSGSGRVGQAQEALVHLAAGGRDSPKSPIAMR